MRVSKMSLKKFIAFVVQKILRYFVLKQFPFYANNDWKKLKLRKVSCVTLPDALRDFWRSFHTCQNFDVKIFPTLDIKCFDVKENTNLTKTMLPCNIGLCGILLPP